MPQKIIRQRKNNRLSNFDYSQNGMYFVTICTRDREEFFGKIEKEKTILNELGKIAEKHLQEMPRHLKGVFLDCFVVMPNHVHCIIEIINDEKNVGVQFIEPKKQDGFDKMESGNVGADLASAQNINGQAQGLSLQKQFKCNDKKYGLLSEIVRIFKSKTTVDYIQLIKKNNQSFKYKIWQRSYYDHIIRNEIELNKIREYIAKNPAEWERDRNNPATFAKNEK